jgi:hypothetical protein
MEQGVQQVQATHLTVVQAAGTGRKFNPFQRNNLTLEEEITDFRVGI